MLDDPALGHDTHAVRHLADHAEVVGDQQQRHSQPVAQILQQLEDLRLHGDVQRRGRLVGDQEIGLARQGHGDHHPLPLPAGELMRIRAQPLVRIGQGDQVQQFKSSFPGVALAQGPVDIEDLADLPLDRAQRVQGRHRLLEHHADAFAAHLEHVVLARAHDFAAVDADRSARMRRVLVGEQLHHRQRRHRLARTGLADQRHRLAAFDGEVHVADHLLATEGNGEVRNLEDRAHTAARLGSKASRTPSPTNTSKVSMIASVKNPARPSQGAWMLALPCASNSPSDG